MRKTVSIIFIT